MPPFLWYFACKDVFLRCLLLYLLFSSFLPGNTKYLTWLCIPFVRPVPTKQGLAHGASVGGFLLWPGDTRHIALGCALFFWLACPVWSSQPVQSLVLLQGLTGLKESVRHKCPWCTLVNLGQTHCCSVLVRSSLLIVLKQIALATSGSKVSNPLPVVDL